jgi:uncharacterized Zn-finger protein
MVVHQCTECAYTTGRKSSLTTHTRVHTGEKGFECTECDFRSSDRSNLARHIRTHTGEKSVVCPECDVRFSQRSDLARHIQTHTGEKRFVCTECDFRFSRREHLASHTLVHSGEKKFECHECEYRCARRSDLVSHALIHGGEKKFVCEWEGCGCRFLRRNELVQHMRTHTGPFCLAAFCNSCVKKKGFVCGNCKRGYGESPESIVFSHLNEFDPRFKFMVRDTALAGCGTLLRPDGYVVLHIKATVDGNVVTICVIIEVDENAHKYADKSCELKRLAELQLAMSCAIFVFR